MKNGVYVVGAFHEMVELLEDLEVPILGLVDRGVPEHVCCQRYPLLGDDESLLALGPQPGKSQVVITPDVPQLREKLYLNYERAGFDFPQCVLGEVSRYATLGDGVVIQRGAYVSAGCQIGKGVKINVGAKVMHDVALGDFVTVAPSAVLLGKVTIGSKVYIGANATVLPHVKIAPGSIIGAGAVVTKDIKVPRVVKGVPAQ